MRLARFAFIALLAPAAATAQLIPLKTVPVAAGDQFFIFPSQRLAMGGVSIALTDSLLDPIVNPATGMRLRGTRLFTAPTVYGIGDDGGAGRTLPFGVFSGSGRWFGGGAVAVQQLEAARSAVCCVLPLGSPLPIVVPGEPLSGRSAVNLYAFGMLGRRLGESRFALAASAFAADLNAVEGVDLLYALSQDLDQFGHLADVRLGLTGDLPGGQSVEAVVLHNRFRMTHDVTYLDWIRPDTLAWEWHPRTRVETNLDRTNTWGVHLAYDRPLGGDGWRIGGTVTANVKSHPKIPNYEIMNIPRDPGTSWAYDLGIGVAKTTGPATFGLDVIYEPIRSHTWAEAAAPVPTTRGDTIARGSKTVDNRFRFSNALVRVGVGHEYQRAAFDLGLEMRSIRYTLRQHDLVRDALRRQTESWIEWTPTWGASLALPQLTIRYMGRITHGTGRPGVIWTGNAAGRLETARQVDYIVAPAGPLTLQDARVVTHQLSVSLPVR